MNAPRGRHLLLLSIGLLPLGGAWVLRWRPSEGARRYPLTMVGSGVESVVPDSTGSGVRPSRPEDESWVRLRLEAETEGHSLDALVDYGERHPEYRGEIRAFLLHLASGSLTLERRLAAIMALDPDAMNEREFEIFAAWLYDYQEEVRCAAIARLSWSRVPWHRSLLLRRHREETSRRVQWHILDLLSQKEDAESSLASLKGAFPEMDDEIESRIEEGRERKGKP